MITFLRKSLVIIVLILIIPMIGKSQNEFGTVGSYWNYFYEHHSGDGSGWTTIKIVKDTLVEGVEHKKYRWTHYYRSFMGDEFEQSWYGLLRIENDSLYQDDKLVLDLNMEIADSLMVDIDPGFLSIQLAIDSIGVEEIGGIDYTKWYGQKLCQMEGLSGEPYEEFTFLESVGQIENGYLFWNFDGCLIGGGSNRFDCYRNGDFTYPPDRECEESFLSSLNPVAPEEPFKIYPNPVGHTLNINFNQLDVHGMELLSLEGQLLYAFDTSDDLISFDVSELSSGLYVLRILSAKESYMAQFFKK